MIDAREDYHTCTVCSTTVHDFGPGADATFIDGKWFHKDCLLGGANAGTLVRAALSDHDTTLPLSSHELRNLAIEIENDLVNSESNFSDGAWRYVDGLRASADALDATTAALKDSNIVGIYDEFTSPADAITQMALWIKEMESRAYAVASSFQKAIETYDESKQRTKEML